ncbi:MAG TPA: hypothetical protein VF384_19405 [Planctomycetota bacterium]
MKPLRILLFVAIASPLLAFLPGLQDPDGWDKDVERACTSQRYGLRLAAARKVAAGGAAAVPAIRAFAQKNGVNAVPAALVDAIADQATLEAAVLELLREWADNGDFYWRASAMRGLALRAPKLPPAAAAELGKFFVPHYDSASWLMRVHAQLGGALLGDHNAQQIPEPDPRARYKEAILLLQHEKDLPDKRMLQLSLVIHALADERTFQGDPWGQRFAAEANKALKAWLGDQYPEIPGGDTEGSVRAIVAAAKQKSGQNLNVPEPRKDPATPFAGGIEILSCKNGDLFVQWTAAGEVHFGLEDCAVVRLPAEAWTALTSERAQLSLGANLGVIVCDAMRLSWLEPKLHAKVAPASLPAAAANWLQHLASEIEKTGQPGLAAVLRTGLEQFAAP